MVPRMDDVPRIVARPIVDYDHLDGLIVLDPD
jgi:hypothetical protein